MKKSRLLQWGKDIFFNLTGSVFFAIGIDTFAKSGSFAPGGISGLALIANHLWGLPVGLVTLLLNLPLVAISWRFVGRKFLGRTLVSVTVCTLMLDFVFPHVPPYTGDPFMAAIYSGLCLGISLALFYMIGSSSGGADLLIMSIKVVRPHLSLGFVTMAIDVIIILLGWPVFGNVDSVLYGLVSVGLCSLVMDKVMYGVGTGKLVLIITDHGMEVSGAIARETGRGATILKGTGAYTGQERQVLLCACSKAEAFKVRSCAHKVDKASFVMIAETSEVYGEGFSDPGAAAGFLPGPQ